MIKKLLEDARALIEDSANWCQGTMARTSEGRPTLAYESDACTWCAYGALVHVQKRGYGALGNKVETAMKVLNECAEEIDHGCVKPNRHPIVVLNDTTDHATVLKAYDCAISKAA